MICSQSAPATFTNPIGLVSLVQRSRLLALSQNQSAECQDGGRHVEGGGAEENEGSNKDGEDLGTGAHLHIQSCGHHIHMSCFASYFQSQLVNERPYQDVLQREHHRIDLKRGFFSCPMCRQIANVLVPIVPGSYELDSSTSAEWEVVARQFPNDPVRSVLNFVSLDNVLAQEDTDMTVNEMSKGSDGQHMSESGDAHGAQMKIEPAKPDVGAAVSSPQKAASKAFTDAVTKFAKRLMVLSQLDPEAEALDGRVPVECFQVLN